LTCLLEYLSNHNTTQDLTEPITWRTEDVIGVEVGWRSEFELLFAIVRKHGETGLYSKAIVSVEVGVEVVEPVEVKMPNYKIDWSPSPN
jgi:hypothetical protein